MTVKIQVLGKTVRLYSVDTNEDMAMIPFAKVGTNLAQRIVDLCAEKGWTLGNKIADGRIWL